MKKITTETQVIEQFGNYSISELDQLIRLLKEMREDLFDKTYEIVEVVNPFGNISEKIKKETGFFSYYRTINKIYQGTNYIVIPKEKFSEKLKEELLFKYDL